MNTRNIAPTKTTLDKQTKKAIADEFNHRGLASESATVFCKSAQHLIRAYAVPLRDEAVSVGTGGTTEAAKNELRNLSECIRHFRGLNAVTRRRAGSMMQYAFNVHKSPQTYYGAHYRTYEPDANQSRSVFDILEIIGNAAAWAADVKVKRGKQPVNELECLFWGALAKAFTDATGKKATSTPSAIFATITAYIAAAIGMDEPSRAVLSKSLSCS